MAREWSADGVLELARSYQPACIITAAADLELFEVLSNGPLNGQKVAEQLEVDLRAVTMLLDGLVALDLLEKHQGCYEISSGVTQFLVKESPSSVLAMLQHQGSCLRRWAHLPEVVCSGKPVEREASIRGEVADEAAYIGAMDNISTLVVSQVIADLQPLNFRRLLDVGGASGTWTIEFLTRSTNTTAILFDLPHVVPLAAQKISKAGLNDRVDFVAGDFFEDQLPPGADCAWISAIVHQNSREQNQRLFSAVRDALVDGGQILIRDILMDDSRTTPAAGALFAIHMLVATEGGYTYTLDELGQDLEIAGFSKPVVLRQDQGMNSVLRAEKLPQADK